MPTFLILTRLPIPSSIAKVAEFADFAQIAGMCESTDFAEIANFAEI